MKNKTSNQPKWIRRLTELCIVIFTHLKLCLADAIHSFKWVKITYFQFHLFGFNPVWQHKHLYTVLAGQGLNSQKAGGYTVTAL